MATLLVNGYPRLSAVEQKAILAALEEYTNALAIYHNTLKKPVKHDDGVSIDCIFTDSDDLETSNMQLSPDAAAGMQDIKEQAECTKLYEDSLHVRRVMEDLKEEIRDQGTFRVLTDEIERITVREKKNKAVLLEDEKSREVATELRKMISDENIANEKEKRRLLGELFELKRNTESLKLTVDVEMRYATAWEKARCEQNSLRCNVESEKLVKMLNDCSVREKNEMRVHEKLTSFFMQEKQLIEKKIEEWLECYNRKKQIYENEIREICNEIETGRKTLDKLKAEYQSNQEFIDTYFAEKKALRKLKEQEEHRRRNGIRIQSWWRGVMVRRKLGPYRPEEKKKKRPIKTKK